MRKPTSEKPFTIYTRYMEKHKRCNNLFVCPCFSEEVEPLKGPGPQVNPEGKASVHTMAHGNSVAYSVVGDDNTRHRRLHDKQEEQRALQPFRN